MLYISVFSSWQATILSFSGSSNCLKWAGVRRDCLASGGEWKGGVRRRVFGALNMWQRYKACEM